MRNEIHVKPVGSQSVGFVGRKVWASYSFLVHICDVGLPVDIMPSLLENCQMSEKKAWWGEFTV
jgi:hypothetical protein